MPFNPETLAPLPSPVTGRFRFKQSLLLRSREARQAFN